MTQKSLVISTLLVGIVLFGVIGCGSDDEKPEKPEKLTEPEPMLINENLLGSWEIISINDGPPLEFLVSDEPDEEDRPKINIEIFNYDFAEDGSWTLNLKTEMVDFPGDTAKEGKVEITGMWSGTYAIQDSHLSLNTKEKDLSFRSVPEDFFEKVAEVTKVEAQQELTEELNFHVLTPFAKTLFTLNEKTLNLESTGTSKAIMVLEKQ